MAAPNLSRPSAPNRWSRAVYPALLLPFALFACSKRSAPGGTTPTVTHSPSTIVGHGDAGKTGDFEPPTEAAMDPDRLPWHGEALRAAVTEVSSANYKRELDRLEAEISPDSGKP